MTKMPSMSVLGLQVTMPTCFCQDSTMSTVWLSLSVKNLGLKKNSKCLWLWKSNANALTKTNGMREPMPVTLSANNAKAMD